jgi:hypothetical protein
MYYANGQGRLSRPTRFATETMSGVSLPVTRPSGRALVVGNGPSRAEPADTLQRMGYGCAELEDPYAAMAELCRRPLVYQALVLSLSSLHREELSIIPGVKRRFPHIDIWLTHTDGRQAALADAMRLGADGLLSGEGLHRVAISGLGNSVFTTSDPTPSPRTEAPVAVTPAAEPVDEREAALPPSRPVDAGPPATDAADDAPGVGEPVLTADELRALLQEQPAPPSLGGSDS